MAREGRGLIVAVFRNFLNSFKVLQRQSTGTLIGEDPFGNKYFEIPADPKTGKRRAQRWFNAPNTGKKEIVGKDVYGGYDAEIPAEWESWLRHRREVPPEEEEILQSLALADLKKRNAAKLEEKRIDELKSEGQYDGPPRPQDHEKAFYPKYDEYEVAPGEHDFKEKKDRWEKFKNPYFDEKTEKSKVK